MFHASLFKIFDELMSNKVFHTSLQHISDMVQCKSWRSIASLRKALKHPEKLNSGLQPASVLRPVIDGRNNEAFSVLRRCTLFRRELSRRSVTPEQHQGSSHRYNGYAPRRQESTRNQAHPGFFIIGHVNGNAPAADHKINLF